MLKLKISKASPRFLRRGIHTEYKDLMELRLAQPHDLQSLATFVNSAYRGDSSKKGWTTEADLLGGQRTDADELFKLIEAKGTVILILEISNQIHGCVCLVQKKDSTYLGMLTVDPNKQGRGIGAKLLALAELWAQKNWLAQKIEMTVIQKRLELIAWYERKGYFNTKKREPFPYGDSRFGLPKVDDLEFVVLEKKLK